MRAPTGIASHISTVEHMDLFLDQLHSVPQAFLNGHPVSLEPWSLHCNVGLIFVTLHTALSEVQYREAAPATHYLTSLDFLWNFAASFSDTIAPKFCTFENTECGRLQFCHPVCSLATLDHRCSGLWLLAGLIQGRHCTKWSCSGMAPL